MISSSSQFSINLRHVQPSWACFQAATGNRALHLLASSLTDAGSVLFMPRFDPVTALITLLVLCQTSSVSLCIWVILSATQS